MEKEFSNIIKTIIYFGIYALVVGVVKNSYIINMFDEELQQIIGISSYTSMTIALLISCIVLGIIGYIGFIVLDLFKANIDKGEFSIAYANFIYVFFFSEAVKLLLVLFVLDYEFQDLIVDDSFNEQLTHTHWYYLRRITETLTVIVGLIIFLCSFKGLLKTKKLVQVVSFSLVIGACIFVSNMKWI